MSAAPSRIDRILMRLRWSHAPVRLVLIYSAAGPAMILLPGLILRRIDVLGLVSLVSFQSFVALVLIAIVRPGSYHRSMWRALIGMLWLMGPLILLASESLPAETFLIGSGEGQRLDVSSAGLWSTLWLGAGFLGCLLSSIVSALPSRSRDAGTGSGAPPDPLPAPRLLQVQWPHVRLGIIVTVLAGVLHGATLSWVLMSLWTAIPRSHVRGNVPSAEQFDGLLRRDLNAYFAKADSTPVQVEYELLRRAPTQVGIAYPKYYAWVRVLEADGDSTQGAVRMAAIDRVRFEVFDFMSSAEILADTARARQTFPRALTHQLLRRAGRAAR